MAEKNSPLLFAGTSHRELAKQVAKEKKLPLSKIEIEKFPDGEIGVRLLENVQSRDVIVLQTIARHPHYYLMELLLIADAMRRGSARSITAIIPYLGYGRQDRRGQGPIAAKLVANMLERAGISRLITVDLHAEQIGGFFDIPVENIYARPLFLKKVAAHKDLVVVTPDLGRVKLARGFAEMLQTDFAVVSKRRVSAKRVETRPLLGDVRGKDVLLVDDICSTGETLTMASAVCRKAGAKRVYAAVTHGLCSAGAWKESAIDKIWITNTVPPSGKKTSARVETVSVASLLAAAI